MTLHITTTYFDEKYGLWMRQMWVSRNRETVGTTHFECGAACGSKMRELVAFHKVTSIVRETW